MILWLALVGCVFITAEDVQDKYDIAHDPSIDADGDGYSRAVDCDDTNPLIHPDRAEVANGVDDNCDGRTDEGSLFYDDDGDGFCENEPCQPRFPGDPIPLGGDCDDTQAAVYPGAPEICDLQKNDCDVAWDEHDDNDGDGWSIAQGDPDDRDVTAVPAGAVPLIAELACDIVRVPAGSFELGCVGPDCPFDAQPAHTVHFTHDLLVARYEVTREQWNIWMSEKTWMNEDCGPRCPVNRVSAVEADEFARRMNLHIGLTPCEREDDPYTCTGWRLPTEAEWERVARADTSDPFSGGTNPSLVGWLRDNSARSVHPVGSRSPNRWGVYDMTGNVWEWTWDAEYAYPSAPQTNPYTPDPADADPLQERQIRGGGGNTLRLGATVYHRLAFWADHADFADRGDAGDQSPENAFNWFGFRLVRTAP